MSKICIFLLVGLVSVYKWWCTLSMFSEFRSGKLILTSSFLQIVRVSDLQYLFRLGRRQLVKAIKSSCNQAIRVNSYFVTSGLSILCKLFLIGSCLENVAHGLVELLL